MGSARNNVERLFGVGEERQGDVVAVELNQFVADYEGFIEGGSEGVKLPCQRLLDDPLALAAAVAEPVAAA